MGGIAPFALDSPATWARLVVAAVWVVFGLVFKVLRALPRHERIVARVVGEQYAPALTRAIGVGETLIGVWMLSGLALGYCAALQTVLLATMNAIELRRVRDLLLAPWPMVFANLCLVTLAWYAAFGR